MYPNKYMHTDSPGIVIYVIRIRVTASLRFECSTYQFPFGFSGGLRDRHPWSAEMAMDWDVVTLTLGQSWTRWDTFLYVKRFETIKNIVS